MMDIKYLKWGWVTLPQCICVEDEKLGTLRIEANCSYIVYFRRRTTHKISWGGRACLRNLTSWRRKVWKFEEKTNKKHIITNKADEL